MLTTQVGLVPEQPPLQPPKVDGDAGLAVRVTLAFMAKPKEQVAPQLMPAG
jgi:hypothetical protein